MTNAELCREIARLNPNWYRDLPGVAVRDPETRAQFRRWPKDWQAVTYASLSDWPSWDALARALAAGPDHTDPVTVNALLGEGEISSYLDNYGEELKWMCGTDGPEADTRTTAILLAKVASLGG